LKNHRFADETACVHAGEDRHGRKAGVVTDISLSSVFIMPEVEELRRYAAGKSDAYMYTRYSNPTVRVAEEKIAALEGADDCVVTSSGMSAILSAVMAVCSAGDEIVSMLDIYGGTLKLFETVLSRFGVTTRFVPFHELGRIERYFTRRTKLLFLETPTNPTLRCCDIERLAAIGRKRKVTVIVDNTFATPILQKPMALGADMIVHSVTKYLGGHSDVTAGAVCGSREHMAAARDIMKTTGGNLDPNAAYLTIRGLKTLQLRVERGCENAEIVAVYLREHPKVGRVFYPGFPENDGHEAASRQMKDFGMMVSFDLKGGGRSAERFINSLKLWYLAASLGGVESSVSYPVLTSHQALSKERLVLLDVSPATVRLSVGIEHAADLVDDLEQALERA
jgi:cystathionine beta-lyase/cystathionine gamma-synthase